MLQSRGWAYRLPPLVFITGPFPPPVHGMATATERLATTLGAQFTVRRFDVAGRKPTGFKFVDIFLRMLRAAWMLTLFACLTFGRRPLAVVTALSTGHANVFDLACITIGLAAHRHVHVTHHSYALFDGRERRWLLQLARPVLRRCRHIALCEHMKSQLCAAWGLNSAQVTVLSNAALVEPPAPCNATNVTSNPRRSTAAFHVGFIANLRADKGLWTFLDIVDRLQAAGYAVHASIAGPVQPADEMLERALQQRLHQMQDVAWLGALHGDARSHFYWQLDLLVFPTVYRHESEPLVILEALAHGVPVITTPRGCIASSLADGVAVRTFPETDFVDKAVASISADLRRTSTLQLDRRVLSHQLYQRLCAAGTLQLTTLIAAIGSQNGGTARVA